METQAKLLKKLFTIIEQAVHQVRGFRNLYQKPDDKIRLSCNLKSTLNNNAFKLAQLSIHFGKLPRHIGDKEMNKYLAPFTRQSKTPSLRDFKADILTDVISADISASVTTPAVTVIVSSARIPDEKNGWKTVSRTCVPYHIFM